MDLRQLLFSFKGRIGRLYWCVASIAAGAIGGMLTTILEVAAKAAGEGAINPDTQQFEPTSPYGIAVSIVGLFNMWIAYALMVKRLHDRDRTGWWVVVPLVAILVAMLFGLAALTTPKE